jgi:predicted flap endonuclease-1-like 5' DNA nuclease
MIYLILEMSVWLLAAFVIGLLLGTWIGCVRCRNSKGETPGSGEIVGEGNNTEADDADRMADRGREANEDGQSTAEESEKSLKDTDTSGIGGGEVDDAKPANLISEVVLDGDDLKKIKGVGPKLEKLLNELGISNYQQIAGWQQKDIDSVNAKLSFSGKIDREDWVTQAKCLSRVTELAERYQKGEQN